MRTVRVRLESDLTSARRDLRGMADDLRGLHGGAQRAGSGMDLIAGAAGRVVAGFAGAGVVEALKRVVGAASDLNETVSKSKQVFGASSGAILAWSKTSAQSMGMSQRAALDGASSFQNLFSQIGLAGDQAAGMSKKLVQLSADFASFHNADPAAVMDALLSATRGEYDALQRFVPTVSAATIETRALADTGKKTAQSLTAAEKATALYEVVVEGAGAATGDFARTSTGAANQQRILKANLENTAASIGNTLLPVWAAMLKVINDVGPGFILAGGAALLLSRGLATAGVMASGFMANVSLAAAATVEAATASRIAATGTGMMSTAFTQAAAAATAEAAAVTGAAGAIGRSVGAAQAATAAQGRLAGAMTLTGTAARGVAGAMASAAPTLAIVAVALGAERMWANMEHNKQAARGLADAVGQLGDELQRTGRLSQEFIGNLARTNPEQAKLIEMYAKAGVTIQDLVAAQNGNAAAMAKVDTATDMMTASLRRQMETLAPQGGGVGHKQALKDSADQLDHFRSNMHQGATDAVNFATAIGGTVDSLARLNPEQRKLMDNLLAMSDVTKTAEERAKALGDAYHMLFDATINLNEANEAYQAGLDGVSKSVKQNGHSLDIHTEKGRANRDAIEAVLTALVQQDQAELASGVTLDQVTAHHTTHIEELRKEAKRLGLNKEETDKLVAAYGTIPTTIDTTYLEHNAKVIKDTLREVLSDLEYFQKYGYLPFHTTPGPNPQRSAGGNRFLAPGGYVRGPGTTTSDSIRAWLSDREFVQPASTVDYYGVAAMEAVRTRKADISYRAGGVAGRPASQHGPATQPFGKMTGQIDIDYGNFQLAAIKQAVMNAIMRKMARSLGPGVGPGGPGWQWQMNVLHSVFPGLALLSGYRPGSRVASGGLSYHAFGRAVDIPPRMDVFDWIVRNFGPATRELIFSPAGGRQIKNGVPHLFTGPVVAEHYNHIHWAMREGGLVDAAKDHTPRFSMDSGYGVLAPGTNWVDNYTGRPEPIWSAPTVSGDIEVKVTILDSDGRVLAALRRAVSAKGGTVQAVVSGRT